MNTLQELARLNHAENTIARLLRMPFNSPPVPFSFHAKLRSATKKGCLKKHVPDLLTRGQKSPCCAAFPCEWNSSRMISFDHTS